ncbi:hypothetical protein O9992_24205 [Vibrio lentus]|nr:hypothetical protein [Vibrio lentus]
MTAEAKLLAEMMQGNQAALENRVLSFWCSVSTNVTPRLKINLK